jgi:hypothetical protein
MIATMNPGPGTDPEERARFRLRADDPHAKAGPFQIYVAPGTVLESNGAIYVIAGRPGIGCWLSSVGTMIAPTPDLLEPLNDAARAMLAVLRPELQGQ